MKPKAIGILLCLFLPIFMSACATFRVAVDGDGPANDPGTSVPATETVIERSKQATPTLSPTLQSSVSASATPAPPPAATSPSPTNTAPTATASFPPETRAGLEPWLGAAQAAGQSLDAICRALQQQGWQQPTDSCQAADLDGDGQDAWLLTLDYTRLQPGDGGPVLLQGHPGDLWIVAGGRVAYRAREPENADFFGSAPQLFELAEMTGDGRPDVITRFTTCGAHTCFGNYQVVSAHFGLVQNIVSAASVQEQEANPAEPPFISMAYVEEETVVDITGDSLPDLQLTGGIIGSAGAGIQRPRTEIWAWNGEAIALAETRWAETGYRFHRLYNANEAFAREAYGTAKTLYEEVLQDESLEEVEWTSSAEAVRGAVRQFAGFRLALLALLEGETGEATRWQEWLQQEYPEAPLSEAVALLRKTWVDNGNDQAATCSNVTAFLADTMEPTGPLAYMGYGNPTLEAKDVCPLK